MTRSFFALGIDPGERSGWGLLDASGRRVASGAVRRGQELVDAAMGAQDAASRGGCYLVVGAERWTAGWAGGRGNFKTYFGMGAAWGRWALALELAGVGAKRIGRVVPATWRKDVLGNGAATKPMAVAYVRAAYKVDVGDDEAEALCIAAWAHRTEALRLIDEAAKGRRREQGR
jgi:Holliday junction resolvasome RuvABC endonuclease subunit